MEPTKQILNPLFFCFVLSLTLDKLIWYYRINLVTEGCHFFEFVLSYKNLYDPVSDNIPNPTTPILI